MPRRRRPALHLLRSLSVVVGIVMIWRGIWYLLDLVDVSVFGGKGIYTAIGGVLAGLVILYLPDRDIKELDKL